MKDLSTDFANLANTISNISNNEMINELNVSKFKLEKEKAMPEINRNKALEAQLDQPLPFKSFFEVMTQGTTPEQKILAASKAQEAMSLIGYQIDENDNTKPPIHVKDGKPLTWRDAGVYGKFLGAYYSASSDPFTNANNSLQGAKDRLQQALPNMDLGPGNRIDRKTMLGLIVASKKGALPEDTQRLVAAYGIADQAYEHGMKNPRLVYDQQIKTLNSLKGIIAQGGGNTAIIDDAIKTAEARANEIPTSGRTAQITGIPEGTPLSPENLIKTAAPVAGYNAHIASEGMRSKDAKNAAVINNLMNILSNVNKDAAAYADKAAESAQMAGEPFTPDKYQQVYNTEVTRRTESIHQQFYDLLGDDGFKKFGLQPSPNIYRIPPVERQKIATTVDGIVNIVGQLDDTKPENTVFKQTIKNMLDGVDAAAVAGDTNKANEILASVEIAITEYENKNKLDINSDIEKGAKNIAKDRGRGTLGDYLFGTKPRGLLNIKGVFDPAQKPSE